MRAKVGQVSRRDRLSLKEDALRFGPGADVFYVSEDHCPPFLPLSSSPSLSSSLPLPYLVVAACSEYRSSIQEEYLKRWNRQELWNCCNAKMNKDVINNTIIGNNVAKRYLTGI